MVELLLCSPCLENSRDWLEHLKVSWPPRAKKIGHTFVDEVFTQLSSDEDREFVLGSTYIR